MVNAGAAPELVNLLRTADDPMLGNFCIRCLLYITSAIGNLDLVLAKEIIPALVKWVEFCLNENRHECSGSAEAISDRTTRHILRLYQNLLAPENHVTVDLAVLDFLPALTRILTESRHGNTLEVGCEALSSLVNAKVIQIALSATLIFSSQSHVCKDKVLVFGVLPKLVHCLIGCPDEKIVSSVCKLIRNLSQKPAHFQQIIDAQLIPGLIEATKRDDIQVQLKAIKPICFIARNCRRNADQVNYLVEQGALEALCQNVF